MILQTLFDLPVYMFLIKEEENVSKIYTTRGLGQGCSLCPVLLNLYFSDVSGNYNTFDLG